MTTGNASIRVVSEEPADDEPVVSAASASAAFAPPPQPDARVDAALGALRAHDTILKGIAPRLAALETVAQQVPAAANMLSALIRALGAKVLALLGLLGCLALAFVVAFNPAWQTLLILAIVVLGVQLPLVLVAYLGKA